MTDPRSHHDADALLQGRCRKSRKLANNTYLERHEVYADGNEGLAVRLHSTDILLFHKDGRITVSTGGWNTITTCDRINRFLPEGWRVWRHRNASFLSKGYTWNPREDNVFLLDNRATIGADGTVSGACDKETLFQEWRDNDRERRRLNYWIRKARGVKRTVSEQCKGRFKWCRCHPRAGRAYTFAVGEVCNECGCKAEAIPRPKRLTVTQIMEEPNASIRLAMAKVYGLDRFLLDSKARVLDTHGEYELIGMELGRWQNVVALKMTCPSTTAVYIHMVPPNMRKVSQALDWYFDVPNYLDTIGAQT